MIATHDSERLLEELPHRAPFRFISEVSALQPRVSGSGVWNVTGDEFFFAGHFPGEPIVPGVLIAEALAQLSGLVAFSNGTSTDHVRAARLAQIDVKILSAITPPAQIHLSTVFSRQLGPLLLFDVSATFANGPAAEGRIVLAANP